MHEEIEYAEMLEIPVSTVNVVKKNSRRKKAKRTEWNENAYSAPQERLAPSQNLSQNLSQNPSHNMQQNTQRDTQNIPPAISQNPLKDSVIAQVNHKLSDTPNALAQENYENQSQMDNETPFSPANEITADADLFAESANSDGRLDFDPIPERIDTVRLYSEPPKRSFWDFFRAKDRESSLSSLSKRRLQENEMDFSQTDWENNPAFDGDFPNPFLNDENHSSDYTETAYEYPKNKGKNAVQIVLNAEFAAACALCAAIFLTNIFMPNSAINTFFRSMNGVENTAIDTRAYSDFTLSPVISELSSAELNLSPTGILSFTEEGCVYPAADGVIAAVEQAQDGTFRIKIAHSDSFTGVIGGLDYVYYAVGDTVKCNVPVGYSNGEAEVQVTMYSQGLLLNCFELTEENCLAWVEEN